MWLRTSRSWLFSRASSFQKFRPSQSNRPFSWTSSFSSRIHKMPHFTKRAAIVTLKVINFACAAHLFVRYVGRPSFMTGPSMLPTFAVDGEIVIEDNITYRLFPDSLKRGDLIVAKSPIDPDNTIVCKRVIGMPGDIICVDPTGEYAPPTEHIKVPKGHIWVSGDNASFSRDSRTYGPMPKGLVIGRIVMRIWPPGAITIFRNPTTKIE